MKRMTLAIKREIWNRAEGRCEGCRSVGDFRGLTPHHIALKQMGGTKREYLAGDYQLLCGRCHSSKHGVKEI